jgi:hypothetical protein
MKFSSLFKRFNQYSLPSRITILGFFITLLAFLYSIIQPICKDYLITHTGLSLTMIPNKHKIIGDTSIILPDYNVFKPLKDISRFSENAILKNGASDHKLEMKANFQSMETNFIYFSLSNLNPGSLYIVDSIILNVYKTYPYKITSFFDGPHAVIMPFKFNVDLSSNKNRYLLTDTNFKYSPYDIDKFVIQLSSKEKLLYKVGIDVLYYNIKNPQKRFKVSTDEENVPFPEYINEQQIFDKAKKVDFFLNNGYSIEAFHRSGFLSRVPPKNIRYIFSDRSSRPMLHFSEDKNATSTNFRFIPDKIYKNVTKDIPTYGGFKNQFYIVNDSLLVVYIWYGRGEIIEQPYMVRNVAKKFNKLYNNMYFEKKIQDSLYKQKIGS